MKKLTTLLLTSLCLTLHAQNSNSCLDHHNRILQYLTVIHSRQSSKASKTLSPKERLIAYSEYEAATLSSTRKMYDSVMFYYYTGLRGSIYDFNSMTYDFIDLPHQSYFPPFYLDPSSVNDIPAIQYDSMLYLQYNSGLLNWKTQIARLYNGSEVIQTHEIDNDTGIYKHYLNYTSFNALRTDIYLSGNLSSVDTGFIDYFIYDNKNRLIEDSVAEFISSSWIPYYKIIYNYDAKNNISDIVFNWSSTAYPKEKYTITYTADNKIKTVLTDTGISLTHYKLDSFSYVSPYDYYAFLSDSVWHGGKWTFNSTLQKYINSIGNPDSLISYFFAGPTSTDIVREKHTYTYSVNHNPLTDFDSITYLKSGIAFVFLNFYYYETYADVPAVNKPENNVQLFPNPVTDELNIKLTNAPARVTLKIFSDDGRLVRRITFSNSGNIKLNISDLLRGAYIYQLNSADGWSSSGKFIKQ